MRLPPSTEGHPGAQGGRARDGNIGLDNLEVLHIIHPEEVTAPGELHRLVMELTGQTVVLSLDAAHRGA